MVLPWCAMDPINIPPMLGIAYIPAPWIRHGYVKCEIQRKIMVYKYSLFLA